MFARLFVFLQFLLPRHWLTAVIYRVTRIRSPRIKDALIRGFMRLYTIEKDEIAAGVPGGFATFNAFFTRELVAGARPIDTDANSIVSPVDGTVSVAASLDADRIIQAKGHDYTLDDLFAIDIDTAQQYRGGEFTTIYLAPYNYHRVHMPVAGELVAAHYVPGDLFSVNEATVNHLPGLFRRNERLNLHFKTELGPAALIFVGALNVGSITTPWTGEIRPRKRGIVEALDISSAPRELQKGDLLGWFNMGSTVIVLLPKGTATWHESMQTGNRVRMGERIGIRPDKLS